MNKLKEILFDEETVEIPVITKEEEERDVKKVKPKRQEDTDDEVIVHQISKHDNTEDLFDMPKLKEEVREEEKTNTFTFPVFDDDDLDIKKESRTNRDSRKEKSTNTRRDYSRKIDLLSSTDYIPRSEPRENRERRLDRIEETSKEKKPFTLSPIISPVYGILNENYKKEDIVTRDISLRDKNEKLDLDSVRKKAYGTLEDEIEVSLTRDSKAKEVFEDVEEDDVNMDTLSEEGISIDDLLVDSSNSEPEKIEEISDSEVTETLADNSESEIEIYDEPKAKEVKEEKSIEKKKEDDKKDTLGEEDLFDLIDSLYTRKEE